jgi:hypothetical protein
MAMALFGLAFYLMSLARWGKSLKEKNMRRVGLLNRCLRTAVDRWQIRNRAANSEVKRRL